MGAVDYISKPINETIALARISTHQRIHEQMRHIEHDSHYDHLTDALNRRSFDLHIELAWDFCARQKFPICVIMIDIDDFKHLNDTYGHHLGDVALKMVAKKLSASLKRSVDKAFRWGGEEFAAILPSVTLENGMKIGEEIRKNISEIAIEQENGEPPIYITASVGVAVTTPPEGLPISTFVRRADMALYKAKEDGKNRVCTWNY